MPAAWYCRYYQENTPPVADRPAVEARRGLAANRVRTDAASKARPLDDLDDLPRAGRLSGLLGSAGARGFSGHRDLLA